MKYGLCCISLKLKEQGLSFQTMTYKRFSSLPREEALAILGDRIHHNMVITNETIKHCEANNYCYRISSDLFPLITFDDANVSLDDLPNHDEIQDSFDTLSETISNSNVRISCHPSEFNVLASTNNKAVEKTITELNFYSSFLDRIGCSASYDCPMNLHVHNRNGSLNEIIERFMSNFNKLDENCKKRLVIENDDKLNCWSVNELVNIFHDQTKIPITFDYLHHKCHPNGLSEAEALISCYGTWNTRPLFHYSESRIGNNPRAHADYAEMPIDDYGLDFDLDMELKAKDYAIEHHREITKGVLI
jgi:UV DNA damage endonuclease